ncbi:MAG: DUF1254 domain-containing protein [Pseudomonadota bacterium]
MAAVFIGLTAACGQSVEPRLQPQTDKVGEPGLSLAEAEAIYDYAYPLVIMKISQDVMFTVPFRPPTTPNHFIHFKRLAQPEQRAVVLGNRNTLYSVGWVDLSKGPVIFEIPDMGDRYYVMPLLDAWTNTFRSLGSRTTGQGAQSYLLVNKTWGGEAPDGHEVITSPTNMVWITGRIQADSAEDAVEAAKLQTEYKLVTLEESQGASDPFADYQPTFQAATVRLPVPFSLNMSADAFYDTFLAQWQANSPPASDAPMVALLERSGLLSGSDVAFSDLEPTVREQLEAGLIAKQEVYKQAFYEGTEQSENWIFNLDTDMGDWGTDFARRAYWAVWGLGTNIVEDAVYGVSQLDENLAALNGANTYRLHFKAGDTPPTSAFWSVTNYDVEGYLERNAVDRYSLGSNHDLAYNEDGSLDVYLSHTQPEDVALNWVPTPAGDFKTLLRIYWPDEAVLNGDWDLPAIQKVRSD